MLELGSPSTCGQNEKKATATSSSPAPTVSPPMSSRHVCSTRSSTPGLTSRSLNGTPRYLSPSSLTPSALHNPLPSRPRPPRCASAPPLDMAIKPPYQEELSRLDGYFDVKPVPLPLYQQDAPPLLSSTDAAPPPPPVLTPDAAMEIPVPDLAEVARLLRLQKYQRRRRLQTESAFRNLQVTISKTNRLATAAHHVQRTLSDCLRSDDKTSFANLYNAFQEACIDHPRLLSLPIDEPAQTEQSRSTCADGFLEGLSSASQKAVVTVLSRLRYDGQFLADRLTLLTQMELATLLPDGGSSRSGDSVLGGSQRGSKRSTRPLGFIVDRQIEDLAASAFRNSLETLVHMHMPSDSHNLETSLSTDVWATVCATLIREKKPGSERLLPALLDIWSSNSPWSGKGKLRLWLLQTLHDGQFLLDQPNRPTFSMRMNGESETSADKTELADSFYNQRVNSLFDILADGLNGSAIPDGSRSFCRAIHNKLAAFPGLQKDLPDFVLTRWLFATFLPDLITAPESHGILKGHYISDLARQRILREVVIRSQKVVSDVVYAWKHGRVVSSDIASRVRKVSNTLASTSRERQPPLLEIRCAQNVEPKFFAVSAADVLIAINALYPARRPVSVYSDRDTLRSGIQSSTSSTSGFSLFRAAEPLPPRWASTPSLFPGMEQAEFLFSPVSPSVWSPMPTQDDFTDDQALTDARTELEEWLATNKAGNDSQWSVFLAKDGLQSIAPYSQALVQGHTSDHDVQSSGLDIDGRDLSSLLGCRAAIEALLCHIDWTGTDLSYTLPGSYRTASDLANEVLDFFDHQIESSEAMADHVMAHRWSMRLAEVETTLDVAGSSAVCRSVYGLQAKTRTAIEASLAVIDQCESWLSVTRPGLPQAFDSVSMTLQVCKRLRTKMWYVADIRTSSAYEHIRAVTAALRVMRKQNRSDIRRNPTAPPLRHWNGPRSSNQTGHLKSEAQILELLSTTPEHGGPNKLSDEQARTVSLWMERNVSQVICAGEERLHNFCMEVRKCVEQLTAPSTSDNPQLWSNVLFSHERAAYPPVARPNLGLSALGPTVRRFDSLTLQTNIPQNIDSVSTASHTLSSSSSRDYFDTRSPTLTTRSSTTFWSPAMSEVRAPSSATSVGSYMPVVQAVRKTDYEFGLQTGESNVEILRETLTGLFLSDLGTSVFNEGCETDGAFWTGLGGQLIEQHLAAQCQQRVQTTRLAHRRNGDSARRRPVFDYEQAFKSIFRAFSYASDPFTKLEQLKKVQILLKPYMALHATGTKTINYSAGPDATTFETLFRQTSSDSQVSTDGFYRLFCDSRTRPQYLFRDLQYMASLIPNKGTGSCSNGEVLSNAITAASRLKSEACQIFIETADSIIAHHTNARGHNRSSSHAQQKRDDASFPSPSHTPPLESIAQYKMEDAAYLLQIAAKEGVATAQRELATLYLTHPDLMDRVLSPFARPREVFREEFEGKGKRDRDIEKNDPGTMCVAIHWMVKAAEGGDLLAKDHLRQKEQLDRLP